MKLALLATLALATLAMPGSAQLLIGHDDSVAGSTNVWHIDLATNTATPLWSGLQCWGLTADDAERTVYSNNGSALTATTYPGCTRVLLGTVTDAAGAAQSLVGLAFANGKLYGTKNIANEAVWEIDLTTLIATPVLDYVDDEYDFGGIDFNPVDGLFYGANDDTTPHGSGIFSLDVLGAGTITKLASFPAGETDIDGCAVGDNKVWLIEDEPAPLHNFDLGTLTYDPTPLMNPITSSEVFSGGGWAPSLVLQGDALVYCTAKLNSCGTLPAIGSMGVPSATAASGFKVHCTNARGSDPFNMKNGVLIYSVSGPGNTPFLGGTLCLKPGFPVKRTVTLPPVAMGTPNMCDAMHVIDMNAFTQGLIPGQGLPDPALLLACQQVWCQWVARDTITNGSLVSDALTYVQAP